ncbi:ABC transporter permease [Paenibacillus sp. HJGM_3]|uniref:ABC transporter permease n=1 Tax=Paenibacillus sp. HJGM_3 TaxID=3379816 RepID=UPI003858E3E0
MAMAPSSPAAQNRKRNPTWMLFLKYKYLYLLMLPGFAYFLIFHYIPLYGITLAFKNFRIRDGILGSPWIGLDNFRILFASPTFLSVFKNTIIIGFYKLLWGTPAPILLALLINEIRSLSYKKLIQTLSYMPHFLSWIIVSGLFLQLLSPGTGPVNYVIKLLGFDPIYFLGDSSWFRTMMVLTGMWKSIGWDSIIYLAALATVNPELYEQGEIDGCSRLQRIWYITLPSIKSVIIILFILNAGSIIDDNFDQIFNFLNDSVLGVGDVLSTYVYRMGLVEMKYSMATAIDLFKNVIAFILVFSANFVAKKAGEEGIW